MGKGEIQQERKRGRSERGEGVKGGCEKGDRRGEEKGKKVVSEYLEGFA